MVEQRSVEIADNGLNFFHASIVAQTKGKLAKLSGCIENMGGEFRRENGVENRISLDVDLNLRNQSGK